jgi:biopolymer transport protein ExbD
MGRFRDSGSDEGSEGGIDMSPMIDCVFILLIFFIVTTTFVEETGIEVDKPQAASAAQLDKNSLLIAVTAEGAVVYGKKDIGVGGVQSLVKRMTQEDPALPVIVQVDAKTPSGIFVRVVDEAKLGGAQKVNVATVKPKG